MAKVRTSVESRLAYLRRLAVVFAAEIRIMIVSELYQREMSAKQFYEEFGGGSISRVDRHFKKLVEHGWLRYIRSEGPGSHRRGGVEHFYRATELAIFDNETWALVPYSVRVAISWRTFKMLAERVREALKAKTLDARPEGDLNYTTMNLDQLGWDRIITEVDALFESIFEEQNDSRLRISHTGEKPMAATVALMAFESPARPPVAPAERTTPVLVRALEDCPIPFPQRVSRVFADELCLKILAEANVREISVPLFYAEFGGSIQVIRRRFKQLEERGWLLQVGEKTGGRRRSAHERFYRAAAPAMFDNESWAVIPQSIKPTFSWSVFRLLADLAKEAIVAGTFEARLDNHLTWTVLWLDQQGWENVARGINRLSALVLKEKKRAKKHLANSGEKPITTTVGLAAFESPRSAAKEP